MIPNIFTYLKDRRIKGFGLRQRWRQMVASYKLQRDLKEQREARRLKLSKVRKELRAVLEEKKVDRRKVSVVRVFKLSSGLYDATVVDGNGNTKAVSGLTEKVRPGDEMEVDW